MEARTETGIIWVMVGQVAQVVAGQVDKLLVQVILLQQLLVKEIMEEARDHFLIKGEEAVAQVEQDQTPPVLLALLDLKVEMGYKIVLQVSLFIMQVVAAEVEINTEVKEV